MNDAFTRRGFGRTLVLGAAGLVFPVIARAQPATTFQTRLVVLPTDALRAELHLTAVGERGAEVITGSIRLVGEIELRGERYPIGLEPDAPPVLTRSRAGTRLCRRVLLPVDHEVLYDTFTARWPRGLDRERARGGSLRVTASPLSDAPGGAALEGLVARAQIA